MQFNARNTFEGLMDIAASSYTDGPKVSIICDELSLCVNGCGLRIPGVIRSAAQARRRHDVPRREGSWTGQEGGWLGEDVRKLGAQFDQGNMGVEIGIADS